MVHELYRVDCTWLEIVFSLLNDTWKERANSIKRRIRQKMKAVLSSFMCFTSYGSLENQGDIIVLLRTISQLSHKICQTETIHNNVNTGITTTLSQHLVGIKLAIVSSHQIVAWIGRLPQSQDHAERPKNYLVNYSGYVFKITINLKHAIECSDNTT